MDELIKSAPSNQIEVDLFKGDWTYKIPIPDTVTGKQEVEGAPQSVRLARACFGPLNGFKVLELGPLECEMTIALSRAKVKRVISVEARSQYFLKCLVIKNILGLKNVRFLLGNFMEFLKLHEDHFDLCLACGVLYHTTTPVELIELICSNCDRVIVESHYVSEKLFQVDQTKDESELPEARWYIMDKEGIDFEYRDLKVKYFKNYYLDATEPAHIVYGHGGIEDYSCMMKLNDIIRTFEHFGFETVGEILDDPDGPRGPHVVFAAKKKDVPLTFKKNRYLRLPRYLKRQFKKRVLSHSTKNKTDG